MDDVPPEAQRELLSVVDEEADRLNRLIAQAVEMAQIETQEVHMDFRSTDLQQIVEEAQRSCSSIAGAHVLTTNVPHTAPVIADRIMIGKVLCNLVENAAKYSEPGSPIFVTAEEQGGVVLTSVADRGVGIDPAEQTLIFDRLYRSRSQSQQTSGTGMGLAISRAIVEAHHGTLTVTSQLGHGSVFTFSLPIARPERSLQN